MNRAERRRSANKTKPKTYVLTEDQITEMKNDAVDEAFTLLLGIPVLVLHDKFGFGRIRIDRFTHYAFSWLEGVHKGEVSLAEVLKILKDEAGVTITHKGGLK